MYRRIHCPSAQREGNGWRLYIPQMRVWNRVLPCTYAPRLKMEVTWADRNWLITCNWTLNRLCLSCSRTHWKVFGKKNSSYFERKDRYVSRKISPRRINCLGHLLPTTQTPEKILPIWPAHLDFFFWLGAPAYFFESSLASSWAPPVVSRLVTLKCWSWSSPVLRSKSICFSCDRALREAPFCRL